MPHTPLALIILDGWGVAPPGPGNAITQASTPNLDRLAREYPHATLASSGIDVGLMWGVVGNSETGHINIGSGRVVYQHLPRILFAIREKKIFQNPALLMAVNWVKAQHRTLHVAGLVSSGTVHGYIDILYAILELARREHVPKVALHLWLDGRDSYIREGVKAVANIELRLSALHLGKIATVMGRSFAMDRNDNWARTQCAYACMVESDGRKITDIGAYLQANYALGLTDEFIEPAVVVDEHGSPVGPIQPGDALVLMNFRADRARQITSAFADPGFDHFHRRYLEQLQIVTMTDYDPDLHVTVAFPQENLNATLAEVISQAGLRQLHIAETEKYAHVTYFFNGRRESPFPGEDRILIPSQHYASFENTPEMQAPEITAHVLEALRRDRYDCYIINFANADMVGHTGNLAAAIKAVQEIDRSVGAIVDAVGNTHRGVALITGDHGNADQMIDPVTHQPRREHSPNPVPLYLIGNGFQRNGKTIPAPKKHIGRLADVAPTILELLSLSQPPKMTGHSLLPALLGDNGRRPLPAPTRR